MSYRARCSPFSQNWTPSKSVTYIHSSHIHTHTHTHTHAQGAVGSLDLSPFATKADLEAQKQSSGELGERVESVEGSLGKLSEQIEELQVRAAHALLVSLIQALSVLLL